MFWKSKKSKEPENSILLGMVILNTTSLFDLKGFLHDFNEQYSYKTGKVTGDGLAASFEVNGELVAIGSVQTPIPWNDIEQTIPYAYNWEDAARDLQDHQGHLSYPSCMYRRSY